MEVELRAASASAPSAALTRVDKELALARGDPAVFLCAHFELLDVLGLHLHVRQFLVLRERQPDGFARHFRYVCHPRIKLFRRLPHASKSPSVPFINEANVLRIDIEAACDESSRWIDGLSVAPHRYSVAVPFGDASARLEWRDDSPGVVVGELFDDVGFPESLLDIAALSERCGQVPPSLRSSCSSEIRRSRRHYLGKIRSERKDLVVDFKRFDGVVGNVFHFGSNDGDNVTLEEELFGQRIRLWRI